MNKSPDDLKLYLDETLLDASKTAIESKLENDSIVYFIYKHGNGWEEIDVVKSTTGGKEIII